LLLPMKQCIKRWLMSALTIVATTTLQAAAPAIGTLAPDFALPSVQGGNVRLSEYRGQVVVLTFWSSRCATCAAQLAALSEQQLTYGPAGLVALAISVDDDMAKARDYAANHASRVPLLLDAKRAVGRSFQVDRLPTTVLIDRQGRVGLWIREYHRIDNSYISQLRALLDDDKTASTPLR
jgi:peroxiredoxin